MDFWGIFTIFLIIFLLMSCCGYCCSNTKRGAVLSTPVVVTSATHTAPGGYPVTQQMPPQHGGYQTNIYATQYQPPPQPSNYTVQMPMPMPSQPSHQPPPGMPGYPPMPMPQQQMNPPPYDVAVATGPAGQPSDLYQKQAPYNPSFTAH